MKMKKLLKMGTWISILLLCTNAFALTPTEFLHNNENNIVVLCEDAYGESGSTALVYECMLSEFYALHKVINLIITIDRNSNDWAVLMELMEENYWADYDTYDFMAIHLDFEEYLEGK